jgi:hypothetical protein
MLLYTSNLGTVHGCCDNDKKKNPVSAIERYFASRHMNCCLS